MHGERTLPEFYLRQEDLPEVLSGELGLVLMLHLGLEVKLGHR